MKLKKALSGILAAAMVVSLTPAMAFATTTGTVAEVPTVASNANMPKVAIDLEVKDASGWAAGTENTIKITFDNANWKANPAETVAGVSAVLTVDDHKTANPGDSKTIISDVISVSDNSVELTLKSEEALAKGRVITLTFATSVLKSESESGPVTIAIDGLDSKVSSATLTVANVGSNHTIASVTGSVKTYVRDNASKTLEGKIEIRESAVNSITDNQIIKLTLPKGISWDDIDASGNLIAAGFAANDVSTGDVPTDLTSLKSSGSNGDYVLSNDGRSMYLYLEVDAEETVREVVTLTSSVLIGKTAKEGDITVDLTSYWVADGSAISDAVDLVVGVYGSELVKILTSEEIPVLYAGYLKDKKDDNTYVQISIKESTPKSLEADKFIDVVFPDEVAVTPGQSIKQTLDKDPDIDDAGSDFESIVYSSIDFESDKDGSEFTVTVPKSTDTIDGTVWGTSKARTWTLFIPVTVQADYTGDITVTLTGARAGIEDTEIVVAKAVSPVTVETTNTDVKNGVQTQALGDITITEVVPGYMKEGTTLTIALDDLGLGNSLVFDDADVEVTSGDLGIKKTTISKGVINIPIKEASTKESVIEIKNISASLNRTLPEGPYDLLVGGRVCEKADTCMDLDALMDNHAVDDEDFDVTPVTVEGYLNIITPAESTTVSEKVDAKFVIGEASYTNNGAATEMDAAAYIDSHNRTMVPIRYVANACGISENDIRWEAGSQTAIINGLNTVVTVKMGSNKLQTSTGEITMDTVAVNNNGRIYVPVRYIANALGANVSWDAATKTVTLTK